MGRGGVIGLPAVCLQASGYTGQSLHRRNFFHTERRLYCRHVSDVFSRRSSRFLPPLAISQVSTAPPVGRSFTDKGSLYDESSHIDLGYRRDLNLHFTLGNEIGRGGSGIVRTAKSNVSGRNFACKSILKVNLTHFMDVRDVCDWVHYFVWVLVRVCVCV
jgi:hypothetical protein